MNLLCPNCQKMLTVPEQYAGQLMKCPLCGGTFTVPGLPASVPAAAAAPAGTAPPPAAPPPSAPAPSQPETFAVRSDGDFAPPPPLVPEHTEPPMVLPAPDAGMVSVQAPATAPPEGYRRTWTIWFSPKVLPWVAPVCVLLVFILQFFPWVGLYQGGVPALTQSAWGAGFAGYTPDPHMESFYISREVSLEKALNAKEKENALPGASVLTIFYLLLFIPTFLLTIASLVVDLVPMKLPPAMQKILPWRWGIVAAANLVVFLFLALQLMMGFSLDSQYKEWVEKNVGKIPEKKTTEVVEHAAAAKGVALQALTHTFWLHLAVLLHLAAIVGAALAYGVERRGKDRPLPRLELMW
jgi:hypothetical protein